MRIESQIVIIFMGIGVLVMEENEATVKKGLKIQKNELNCITYYFLFFKGSIFHHANNNNNNNVYFICF